MALNTYASLKTSIAGWMNVSATDLSSQIDDVVTVAETRIYRETYCRDNELAWSTAIASGVVSVPSDYVKMKNLRTSANPAIELERRPLTWIYGQYPRNASSGNPIYFARDGSNFVFGPYPSGGFTVTGCYYKKFAALSSATNALFLNNPDLYLFACLAESEILIGRDSRIPLWESKYKTIRDAANLLSQSEEQSGSTLRMRLGG